MNAGVVTALVLAIPVGLTLGALGGGGSILTLPIFVFIAGIPTAEAVAMSLVIVGGASLPAAGLHYWRGNFHMRAALYFAATGVISSYFGSYLTQMVSQRVLLGIFAALMLIAGGAMVRRRSDLNQHSRCNIIRCLAIGAIVGGLTGFLGVGGGFMIVPALVLFAGIETKDAVGASLAIITLNAAGGAGGANPAHIHRLVSDARFPRADGFRHVRRPGSCREGFKRSAQKTIRMACHRFGVDSRRTRCGRRFDAIRLGIIRSETGGIIDLQSGSIWRKQLWHPPVSRKDQVTTGLEANSVVHATDG